MSKTSMFCFVYVCRRMLNPSMIICVCCCVKPTLSSPSWPPFWATASTAGGNETCVAVVVVVKYRWQIDRLKILQALLGIFCAKIPFCSLPFRSPHTWRNPVFAFYFCLLVKYICFCVGFVFVLCISHMVIIDTYIVFDCSLFLLLLVFLLSSFAVRWNFGLVKFIKWDVLEKCGDVW